MDETYKRIRERWPKLSDEVREAFEPVRQAMVRVRQAADSDVTLVSSDEFNGRLRATIERLREACVEAAPGQLPPCLLGWPAAR